MSPAIRLDPMTPEQFAAFLQQSIPSYARDGVTAGRWAAAESERFAQQEFDRLLPAGAATPDHWFAIIRTVPGGERVGHLWWSIQRRGTPPVGFVFDLLIDPAQRRKGFAEAALRAAEDDVRAKGADRMGLNVFAVNAGALALYTKLGYVPTGHAMLHRFDARPTAPRQG